MSRGILATFFPSNHDKVSRLRQSATDAASDFASNASQRINGAVNDFADTFRIEGRAGWNRAATQLGDLARTTRDMARERPLTFLGLALAVGLLIGWSGGFHTGNRPLRR